MPNIQSLEKPEIYLVGNLLDNNGIPVAFEGAMNHSVIPYTTSTNLVATETTLNSELEIPVFEDAVRVVITPWQAPEPVYENQTLDLGDLQFQGDKKYIGRWDENATIFNEATVYYTLNGADPRKQPLNLYSYKNISEREVSPDPSTGDYDNINELGFVIGRSPSGSDSITIKARTFFRGQVSPTTVVKLRIARTDPLKIGRIHGDIKA